MLFVTFIELQCPTSVKKTVILSVHFQIKIIAVSGQQTNAWLQRYEKSNFNLKGEGSGGGRGEGGHC